MNKKLVPALQEKDWTEEKLNSYKKNLYKLSKKEVVKTILSFIKNNTIEPEDMKVFNKILGDHKLLNKIQICTDGSYVNGRIFYKNFYNGHSSILVDGDYWMQDWVKNTKERDKFYMLNYMKYNFEVIYLHLVDDMKSWDDKIWSDTFDNDWDYGYEY